MHAVATAAREGAAVAVADMVPKAAKETVQLVEAEGGTAATVIADVAEPRQCDRLVDEAADALGGIDGVVHNVGVGAGRKLDGTSAETWDRVLAVNLRSHFLVARHALPKLPPGGSFGVGGPCPRIARLRKPEDGSGVPSGPLRVA